MSHHIKPIKPRNHALTRALELAHKPGPRTLVPFKKRNALGKPDPRQWPFAKVSNKPVTLPKLKFDE